MKSFLTSGLLFYSASSLIPALKSTHWAIRVWDFPRLQMMLLGLIFFAPMAAYAIREKKKSFWLLLPVIGLGFDAYRLYPYTPFSPIESKMHDVREGNFSVMIFNVLQTNEEKKKLAELIRKESPDFVFLFEVDKKWTDSLDAIEGYLVRHYHPLDNTYGIAFLSKLEIESFSLEFLVEKDIPSYEIKFRPDGKEVVTIFAVHPRPPRPPEESEDRDAELVLVAKKARKLKGPVLVVGDMNDVAWSHTTRLFRRISGLLDPRVGRRPYGTFPSLPTPLRFPLDYIFHSEELKLTGIQILPDIGSDHLPMRASFFVGRKKDQESFEKPEPEDFREADKIINKGLDK